MTGRLGLAGYSVGADITDRLRRHAAALDIPRAHWDGLRRAEFGSNRVERGARAKRACWERIDDEEVILRFAAAAFRRAQRGTVEFKAVLLRPRAGIACARNQEYKPLLRAGHCSMLNDTLLNGNDDRLGSGGDFQFCHEVGDVDFYRALRDAGERSQFPCCCDPWRSRVQHFLFPL